MRFILTYKKFPREILIDLHSNMPLSGHYDRHVWNTMHYKFFMSTYSNWLAAVVPVNHCEILQ